MKEQEALRLYALALSLIPDEDEAGDLFMEARSEVDLLRRAAIWLERRGLPPPPPALIPVELHAGQAEQAMHLARRARMRLRLRRVFAAAAAVGAFAAGVIGYRFYSAVPTGVAADPAFAEAALTESPEMERLRFYVYRAEATPGTTTLWWEVYGHRAARRAATVRPALFTSGAFQNTLYPDVTETGRIGPDRLLGKSTYRTLTRDPFRQSVMVLVNEIAGQRVTWLTTVPLHRIAGDSEARTIAVNQTVRAGNLAAVLTSLTAGANYTLAHFTWDGQLYTSVDVHGIEILADGEPLGRRGWWSFPSLKGMDLLMEPLPAGTLSLTVRFTISAYGRDTVLSMPSSAPYLGGTRESPTFSTVVTVPPGTLLTTRGYFRDLIDRHYPATLEPVPPMEDGGYRRYLVTGIGVPADTHLLSLTVVTDPTRHEFLFRVDLPR